MPEDKREATNTSDEDLLAQAISIEGMEDEDNDEDQPEAQIESIDLSKSDSMSGSKIVSFDQRVQRDTKWKRQPIKTGTGATHLRTFVSKLRLDAIDHLDEQINEWLDEHPDYEVKFVSTSVGILTGKLKEEAIFVNVWV